MGLLVFRRFYGIAPIFFGKYHSFFLILLSFSYFSIPFALLSLPFHNTMPYLLLICSLSFFIYILFCHFFFCWRAGDKAHGVVKWKKNNMVKVISKE